MPYHWFDQCFCFVVPVGSAELDWSVHVVASFQLVEHLSTTYKYTTIKNRSYLVVGVWFFELLIRFVLPFYLVIGYFDFYRLEPLLLRIKQKRSAILCPGIDMISDSNMGYGVSKCVDQEIITKTIIWGIFKGTGDGSVGGFWWSLHFNWIPVPARIRNAQKSRIDPYSCVILTLLSF